MPRVKMFALNPAQQRSVDVLTARILWDGESPEVLVGAAVTVKGNTFMLAEDGSPSLIATDPQIGDESAAHRAISLVEDINGIPRPAAASPARGRRPAAKKS